MDTFTTILVVSADVLAVIAMIFWIFLAIRIVMEITAVPDIRAGLSMEKSGENLPPVVVIIPAHNEETKIGDLLNSLRALRYPHLQIILAMDRCTDRSVEIAREISGDDKRVQIITIDECPDGWAGKVNAAYQGALASGVIEQEESNAWLLFSDADTVFHPDLVTASIRYCLQKNLGFLSLHSTLSTKHWFERLVQPVTAAQFLQIYPLRKANRDKKRRPVANGQFMLFSREAYIAAGTHKAVRRFLLEDLVFARKLDKANVRMGMLPAGDMLSCAMYDSFAEFREGWKRIFIEALHWKIKRLKKAANRQRLIGISLLIILLVNFIAMFFDNPGEGLLRFGILVATQIVILSPVYHRQRVSALLALFYPVGVFMLADILSEAARDLEKKKEVSWGGRKYLLESRSGETMV